jgi:hypothetical protein
MMAPSALAPSVANEPAYERRIIVLLVALGFAVATQWTLALVFGAAPGAARGDWSVAIALCLLLALPGAGMIRATWVARDMPTGWRVGLAIATGGILMRAPYFGAGPMLEDDHFRYLLDGAMTAHGMSPYAHAPEALLKGVRGVAPELVDAGRGVIAAINFPDLRSIYPVAAQALFALAHLVAPWSIDGLRVVVFAAEATTALLVWRALVSCGRSPLLVALYWCNPLMAFCLTGQAHIDAALAPPVLAALFAADRHRGALAGICLGIAAGVKLWPILLAPLVARALWPLRTALLRFAAALGATTLVLCGPLLWASLHANAGLTAYAGGWSINNAPFAWASWLFLHMIGPGSGEGALRALVMLASMGASLAVALARPLGPDESRLDDLIGRAAILAATLFYLSPAQFPWYAVWFLPLAVATGGWVLTTATVGLPVYFLFFPLALAGLRDIHGYGLAVLHLAPLLATAILLRRAAPTGGAE